MPILRDVLPRLSILTMNRREAGLLTGATAAALVWERLQPRLRPDARLVLRDGASGAFLFTSDEAVLVSSPPVTMIDSTGAGDTHTGVLIAAMVQGLEPVDAMRRANAAAAMSVTLQGPATAPGRAELDQFLALERKES